MGRWQSGDDRVERKVDEWSISHDKTNISTYSSLCEPPMVKKKLALMMPFCCGYVNNIRTNNAMYNASDNTLLISTTRPLVLKNRPWPSLKNSLLFLVRLSPAIRIIRNPNTVYNTNTLLFQTIAMRWRTANCIKLLLKDLQDYQSKRKFPKTRSPICGFKCSLAGTAKVSRFRCRAQAGVRQARRV